VEFKKQKRWTYGKMKNKKERNKPLEKEPGETSHLIKIQVPKNSVKLRTNTPCNYKMEKNKSLGPKTCLFL